MSKVRRDYTRYVWNVWVPGEGVSYLVADWDPDALRYRWPLDANQRRAMGGTHASTSRWEDVPRYATRRQALRRARTLWGP